MIWPFDQARSLVRSLQADESGNLWALFEREGLARYDGRRWELVHQVRGAERFSAIDGTTPREYWLSHEGGISRLRNGRWVEEEHEWMSVGLRPSAIERTSRLFGGARQWAGSTSDGLWYRHLSPGPGRWKRFDHPQMTGMVMDLLRSEGNGAEELWALMSGGIARIRDDSVRFWSKGSGDLPTNMTYDMVETRNAGGDGTLWIASRAGLLRVHGDRIDIFDRRHGLPSDVVRGVAVQPTAEGVDVLWLATEGGMVRAALTDTPWRTASLLGARDNGVLGLMLERVGEGQDRLWIGSSSDGLAMLERGIWRRFTYESDELPARSVRGIWRLRDPEGRYRRLLGFFGTGLMEIRDDFTIVPFASPWKPHPGDTAMAAIARTYDGAVEWWIATRRSGTHRWRNGRWTSYALRDRPAPWRVFGLAEQIDRAGRSRIWAASASGLAWFDEREWRLVPSEVGLPDDEVYTLDLIAGRARQELWAGTLRNGLVRLDVTDPDRPTVIRDAAVPPPPDPTVYSVIHDARGRVYVCTNNGVQLLTPSVDGAYRERVFRRGDGLVHDECNHGSEAIDSDGRYWIGTLGGLGMFDPDIRSRPAMARPRPLLFTALQVDGAVRWLPDDAGLKLPPNARELRIEYALLSGIRETETSYRSQLVGYDATPTDWVSERSRSFTYLFAGDYELKVEARDYAGAISQAATLRFSVVPAWYQRQVLQVSAAAFLMLLSLAGVWNYHRVQRARQLRLREEVRHRTAELHAANERLTELSYVDPLTGISNRRRLMEALDLAIARARNWHLPIGLSLLDVDHFKAYNDRHGHLAGDAALRAVAQTLYGATRPQDLVARFGGEEFACLMIDVDPATVERIAERMRAGVEALTPRAIGNDRETVTLSVGALCRIPAPNERAEDLLRAADTALYEAKQRGRNRVVLVADRVLADARSDRRASSRALPWRSRR